MLFILLKIEWLALRVLAKQCPQSSRFTIQIALDLIIITTATAPPRDDRKPNFLLEAALRKQDWETLYSPPLSFGHLPLSGEK